VAAVLSATAPTERRGLYLPLLIATTLLAFCVVGLGAYVRLADAGLGCPDWPGCYGHLVGVPESAAEHEVAASAFPGKPVEVGKAWKEMIHRYAAGTLGLLILGIAISAWRRAGSSRPWLETGLVGLVVFQALLGMWTVTLLLKPVIVTAHLLGGMATWALLVLCLARAKVSTGETALPGRSTRLLGRAALVALVGQIALGGWVSSNYAALACPDFPACRGAWLPIDGPTFIHMIHRLGALLVLVIVGAYATLLLRQSATRRLGALLVGLLALQVGLGIANVLLSLPLPVAVAHNLGAALLLATLVVANLGRYGVRY
jgi:cytochrome c oxidase assembly protein subunit 15